MSMGFQIKGEKDLRKMLKKLPEEFQEKAEAAVLRAAARVISKRAKNRVHVRTGNLRKSIGVSVRKGRRGMGFGHGVAKIGPRRGFAHSQNVTGIKKRSGRKIQATEYAWYLEVGTPNMSAKPFIRPSLDESKVEARQVMAAGLDKYLRGTVNRMRKRRVAR